MRLLPSFADLSRLAGAIVAALVMTSTAGAVVVAPGGGSPLAGTTSAANPDLAGVVINDNLIPWEITDGSGAILVSGNLQNRVTVSDTLGTLIFAPRLTDIVYGALGEPDSLDLTLSDYGAGLLDIDFRTDGLGEASFPFVGRSAGGGLLFFPIDGASSGPGSTLFLSILSTATNFSLSGMFTIVASFGDDPPLDFSTTVFGLAVPAAGDPVIPLPAAAPLFIGALAIGSLARRSKRSARKA